MSAILRLIVSVIFTFLFIATPTSAADSPLEWHWIVVAPGVEKNWTIEQGVARVTLGPHEFEASLKDDDVVLKGQVVGDHVTAVETLVGTDAHPRIFHGEISRNRSRLIDPANGWGEDRISLYAPGGFYIGLVRQIRSGAPTDR